MVSKLPRGTLERLPGGSRTALQQVILSGQKDNFRVLVGEILSGNDEKSIEEIEGIIDLLDDEFREYFLDYAIKEAEYSSDFAKYTIPALINSGKVNDEKLQTLFEKAKNKNYGVSAVLPTLINTGKISNKKLQTLFKASIKRAENNHDWASIILPTLINTGKISDKNLQDLFEVGIQKSENNDNFAIHILPALINTGKISDKRLQNFFEFAIKKSKNNGTWVSFILPALINTGKIKDESLQDLFEFAAKSNDTTWNYSIVRCLINTGKIRNALTENNPHILDFLVSSGNIDDSKKLQMLFDDIIKNNKYNNEHSLLLSLINTGKISGERLQDLFEFAISRVESNSNFNQYIIPALIETGKISDERLQAFFEDFVVKVKNNNNLIYYIPKVLINSGKISDERLQTFFDDVIKEAENDDSRANFIVAALINSGKINNERLQTLFEFAVKKAENNYSWAEYILPALINSGKISNERLQTLFEFAIKKAENNDNWLKYIIPALINTGKINIFQTKDESHLQKTKDKYPRNFSLLKEILDKLGFKSINFFNYLKTIFLQTEKLEAINNFFDYDDVDKNFFIKNLDEIVNISKRKSLEFGYFKVALKHGLFDSLEDLSSKTKNIVSSVTNKLKNLFGNKISLPINKGNFLDFLDEDEPFLEFEKDKGVDFEIKPWTKKWFLEKPERRNYLDKDKIKVFEEYGTEIIDSSNILLLNINVEFLLKNKALILDNSKRKGGLIFGYFKSCITSLMEISEDFPINKGNFTDYLDEDEPFLEFEEDKGVNFEIKPFTKRWFLENPERVNCLDKDKIKTFEKFGTIIALGLIEGSKNVESVKKFYEHIFSQMKYSTNRTSILQLGEVFNLILKQENYEIFNELIPGVGDYFRSFIEDYNISDKGRTILTLMIVREIKNSFQIFGKDGKEQVDYTKLEEMIKRVYEKLKMYRPIIDKYKDLPIQTSIGMEYEVTQSIAKGYKEEIGSDYKNDIVILSEYSGVANGRDAVHEIATRPTNNPYLLILEMKLLDDLDFVDLNFKRGDYVRGSRGLHITLGGEFGIVVSNLTNFIQNILIAGNLGGVNVGEEISGVNNCGTNIREKRGDSEILFGEERTECTEFRALSIDKKEQFERLVISIFNLNMAHQLLNKGKTLLSKLDDNSIKIRAEFLELIKDIKDLIRKHNSSFKTDESLSVGNNKSLEDLLMILTSTSPLVQIFQKSGVDIYYLRGLYEAEISSGFVIENQSDFENILKRDGKNIDSLSERQREILYLGYKAQIRKLLSKLREENEEIYDNIGEYLNGNTDETIRKITNRKRFEEVIASTGMSYEQYMKSLEISFGMYDVILPELVNIFTRINNLFIKKDSTNALSMYDNTREENGEIVSDRRLTETTIFDKVEQGLAERFGHYIIQGASENMLTQAIQARILEFNKRVS